MSQKFTVQTASNIKKFWYHYSLF